MNSGDFNAQLQPVGMLFTKNKNNIATQALSMYPWQITIIDYNSTLGGTKHTDITPESITTYMGTIEYCDGSGTAIPNVKWVNTNIDSAKTSLQSWVTGTVINQTTPTSDSTSTDKVPSYAACASMIRNIKSYVDNKLSTAYNNGYSAGYSVGYSAGYSAGAASAAASSGSSSS